MRLASLLGPDLKVALETDPGALKDALEEFHPQEIAEIAEGLDFEHTLALMRALPDDFAAEVLERLATETQKEILKHLSTHEAADIVAEMRPDDRADVVQELDEGRASEIIAHLEEHEPEVAEEVRELSAYPEDVAGGLMTTDVVSLEPETKIWQAIDEVRRLSRETESIYYIYVVFAKKLVGVLSLRDLILREPGQTLGDVMTKNVVSLRATDDQEEVARTMAKYDFNAMPVVDEHGNLLGVITVDDVVDVVIEEATEDAHLMGAVSPMIEEKYLETRITRSVRSRIGWLMVLFIGGFLTASVMEAFESELRAVISLAVFVPLIISSGGNAGSQSASLIIRALAVGDVRPSDWTRVLGREALTSLALGAVLGVLGFLRAFFTGDAGDPFALAITVSASTLAVVVIGSLLGSLLPIAIQRAGFDPAVSSTPFIASLSDVVGLLIYLTVAKLVIGIG
jgi:magnesium transporter